jgi:putative ABC transport system ATP-binding protein
MNLLELHGITKSFGRGDATVQVLRGVSLTLGAGETMALTGDSGSGKSTLLHIAGGLDVPDRGQVILSGQDMSDMSDTGRAYIRRALVGLVFQQFNLIPSLTVADNLSFQARLAGRHDPAFGRDLAQRLGLDGLLARYPEQLSGGQQQRVAIGRALAARPVLVLADEPTGNLDEGTADAVMDLLRDMVAQSGAGLLLVTHSARMAARCDTVRHLRAGQVGEA